MKLERILPFAKDLLKKCVHEGDIAVDATLGNGHDTLFLTELVGETGLVYGFDIQAEAVQTSQQRLTENNVENRAILTLSGHEHVSELIPLKHHGKVAGAIFNLGYLPGGDKSVVTKPATTISAIEQLLTMMKTEGIIILVIYHGHPEGSVEKDSIEQFVTTIDQKKAHVMKYQFINQQNNPPYIIAIEKR